MVKMLPPPHFKPSRESVSQEYETPSCTNLCLQLYLLPWGGFLEVELMGQGISAFQRLGTGCQVVYEKG